MERKNPLFAKREVVAAAATSSPPLSSSGKPMVLATCAGIQAWVDLDGRVVIPVKQLSC